MRPLIARMSVLLPQPDGPATRRTSPASTREREVADGRLGGAPIAEGQALDLDDRARAWPDPSGATDADLLVDAGTEAARRVTLVVGVRRGARTSPRTAAAVPSAISPNVRMPRRRPRRARRRPSTASNSTAKRAPGSRRDRTRARGRRRLAGEAQVAERVDVHDDRLEAGRRPTTASGKSMVDERRRVDRRADVLERAADGEVGRHRREDVAAVERRADRRQHPRRGSRGPAPRRSRRATARGRASAGRCRARSRTSPRAVRMPIGRRAVPDARIDDGDVDADRQLGQRDPRAGARRRGSRTSGPNG